VSGAASVLRRPLWAMGLVGVIVLSVGFAAAGVWQLNRLEDRRALNGVVAAALAADPVPLRPGLGEYTVVTATGSWLPDREFALPLQTRDGVAGLDILTVLETPTGSYLVDRGWVPLDDAAAYPRSSGAVDITAWLRDRTGGRLTGESEGGRPVVTRRDPAAIGDSLEDQVLYLISAVPHQDPAPLPPRSPDLGEGNHLLYAIQWFSFIGIALVGYGALLRRQGQVVDRPDVGELGEDAGGGLDLGGAGARSQDDVVEPQ
jgi:cytochrome oxidase assembly protein ShyY1